MRISCGSPERSAWLMTLADHGPYRGQRCPGRGLGCLGDRRVKAADPLLGFGLLPGVDAFVGGDVADAEASAGPRDPEGLGERGAGLDNDLQLRRGNELERVRPVAAQCVDISCARLSALLSRISMATPGRGHRKRRHANPTGAAREVNPGSAAVPGGLGTRGMVSAADESRVVPGEDLIPLVSRGLP